MSPAQESAKYGGGFVALDLGTAWTRTSRGAAIAGRPSEVLAASSQDPEARVRPLRHGMVADPAACLRLVREALQDARPPDDEPVERVLVGVPLAATQSDRRAVHAAVIEAVTGRPATTPIPATVGGRAGGIGGPAAGDPARHPAASPAGTSPGDSAVDSEDVSGVAGGVAVWLVDEPVAAAVGAGLDVSGPQPFLLLDVGAGIVEAVAGCGGSVCDAAALQLGATTSAGLLPYALDGVVEMTAALVRRLPDDVRRAVPSLTVTGGGARQQRLLQRLQPALRMPVHAAPEPEHATIRGLSLIGRRPDLLPEITRYGR